MIYCEQGNYKGNFNMFYIASAIVLSALILKRPLSHITSNISLKGLPQKLDEILRRIGRVEYLLRSKK